MKTTILNLLIVITLLSSCNTARNYANYRVGGKSEKTTTLANVQTLNNEILKQVQNDIQSDQPSHDEIKIDSVCNEIAAETTEIETLPIVEKKSSTETKQNITEEIFSKEEPQQIIPKNNKNSSVIHSVKTKIAGNKNFHSLKSKKVTASDVFDTFIGILLLASLIFTVVTYLMSVNFAIADVILIALAIGLGILLCVGLGKLIMGMFPGMSKKKKSQKKIVSPIKKSKAGFQKYGTDIEDVLYFIIGLLLIAAGIMALLAAGISVAEIIIFGLGLIGFLILLYFIGEALMNIFPGMSRKNKKPFSIKTIIQKILPSKSMKNYGGMSIKDYFNIGLLVIIAAGLFTFVFFSLFDAIMLATLLFSIHLVISLMLCIGYGLVYICTGGMMNLKK